MSTGNIRVNNTDRISHNPLSDMSVANEFTVNRGYGQSFHDDAKTSAQLLKQVHRQARQK